MKPNHFAKHKPTVVLLLQPDAEPQKLVDDAGNPRVFRNYRKALKHVQQFIDQPLHKYIDFVNEVPVYGAGDKEETNNARCLKCNSFLRPSLKEHSVNIGGNMHNFDVHECPQCDLGEQPIH